jgi:competence protein ComEC
MYSAFKPQTRVLRVSFLDIGQGDAIFITSPTGKQIIVDGGPGSTLLSQISKEMSVFDKSIDMIVVTNPDKDHFEGFIPLISHYRVGAVLESSVSAPENSLYRELEKEITEKKVVKIIAQTGQRVLIGGGAYIDILFPDRDVSGVSHNDGSVVAKLVYGNTSVLLTGDSPQNIEGYLVDKNRDMLDADILKVGHHGSRTSTSEAFVQAVSPDVAVISAGKGNSYGHPHKETLDTLAKEKVPVLVTSSEGTIVYESDGEKFVRK